MAKNRTTEAIWKPALVDNCLLELVSEDNHTIEIDFDLVRGVPCHVSHRGKPVLSQPMKFDFWRPITDNNLPTLLQIWEQFYVKLARLDAQSYSWEYQSGKSEVALVCHARIAPPVLEWTIDLKISYVFCASRFIEISVLGSPTGNFPQILPRIGWPLPLAPGFERVQWYDRGPGESYKDKKGIKKGMYECFCDEMFTDYEMPQECGNRIDTRWAIIWNGEHKNGVRIRSPTHRDGFDFSAMHYWTEDIDNAEHPHELRKTEETILRIDFDHTGVGTGACGPRTLEKYQCKTRRFELKVMLDFIGLD